MSGHHRRIRSGGGHFYNRGGGVGSRGHVVNPWESGVVPGAGNFINRHSVEGSINQLKQMGSQESSIALNILNAVLSSSSQSRGDGLLSRGGGPPSKMRRMEWGSDRYGNMQGRRGPLIPDGMRKVPGRTWSERPRDNWGYSYNIPPGQDRRKPFIKKTPFKDGKKQRYPRKKKVLGDGEKVQGKSEEKKKDEEKNVEEKKQDDQGQKEGAKGTPSKEASQEGMDTTTSSDAAQGDVKKDNSEAQQSNDKASESKENNEKTGAEENDNKKKSKKEPPKVVGANNLPTEALHCQICAKQFKTLNGFQNHLEGRNHERLARLHMEKSEAMLNLVKAQSRLASQRHIVSVWKNKGKITICHKCQCPIKGGMIGHLAVRPHAMVVLFNKCPVCRTNMQTLENLEKHRTSLSHLSRTYSVQQNVLQMTKNLKRKEYDFPEMESMNKVHDAVVSMRQKYFNTQVWNLRQIQPYDPGVPTGLNFSERIPQFYCTICSKKILHTAKGALAHFRSQKHYENYVAHLKAQEEKEKKEENEKKDDEPEVNKSTKENGVEENICKELVDLKNEVEEVSESIADLSKTIEEGVSVLEDDPPGKQLTQSEGPEKTPAVDCEVKEEDAISNTQTDANEGSSQDNEGNMPVTQEATDQASDMQDPADPAELESVNEPDIMEVTDATEEPVVAVGADESIEMETEATDEADDSEEGFSSPRGKRGGSKRGKGRGRARGRGKGGRYKAAVK